MRKVKNKTTKDLLKLSVSNGCYALFKGVRSLTVLSFLQNAGLSILTILSNTVIPVLFVVIAGVMTLTGIFTGASGLWLIASAGLFFNIISSNFNSSK